MRPEFRDIRWRGRLSDGLAEAAERRLMVVVKPAGQGADRDDWCPGATRMRAVSLSDPEAAWLIENAFIPVRFGMTLSGGPESDEEGRAFVFMNMPPDGPKVLPGLLVLTPEREIVGRIESNVSAEEMRVALQRVLEQRPELAPPELPARATHDPSDALQASLAELDHRWSQGERATLVPELEAFIDRNGGDWAHGAAVAWTLLGAARYHAKDFVGADAAWQTVLDRHPDHPLRHRAHFNLLHTEFSPLDPHPDLLGAAYAEPGARPAIVPDPDLRARQLAAMRADPRYIWTRSGVPLVRIPAGTFTMGGAPALFPRELPLRRVTLSRPFLMSAWPVTRAMWYKFKAPQGPVPNDPLADEQPIARTKFDEALAYCAMLSEVDGLAYGLPSEAQWEYAARGGAEGEPYPWGHQPADATRCNYLHSAGVPVGCYAPNGFGLFDMVGNLLEWTSDAYCEDAYSQTPLEVVDPVHVDPTSRVHTTRGGPAGLPFCRFMCRTAFRMFTPDDKGFTFRLVAPAD
jgi:formylglycine-generating enzyme required for sulfatase activity